jgi:hypothetical protein
MNSRRETLVPLERLDTLLRRQLRATAAQQILLNLLQWAWTDGLTKSPSGVCTSNDTPPGDC